MRAVPMLPPRREVLALLRKRRLAFVLLIFLANTEARAADLLRSCQPTDSPLVCRLRSVLTLLDTAAAVLVLLFVCAIVAALAIYRRRSHKLSPEEITHDAP